MKTSFGKLILASAVVSALGLSTSAQAAPPLVKIFTFYSDAAHEHWTGTWGHDCNTGNAYTYGKRSRYMEVDELVCHGNFDPPAATCYDIGLDWDAPPGPGIPLGAEQIDCQTSQPVP